MDEKPKLKKNIEKQEKSTYITRSSEHGMLLCDYGRDCIFETNDTGTMIVELMNGENTVEDILNKMCEEYDADRECIQNDLTIFLRKMEELKLVSK
ncbi:MAG: PqqD family protein [Halobacteriota archaeon]|nr:PqqD family protein [Halobacteriota archaeon]